MRFCRCVGSRAPLIDPRPGRTSRPGVQIRGAQCSQSANLHPVLLGHGGAFLRAILGQRRKGFGSCLASCGACSTMSCDARRAQWGTCGSSTSPPKASYRRKPVSRAAGAALHDSGCRLSPACRVRQWHFCGGCGFRIGCCCCCGYVACASRTTRSGGGKAHPSTRSFQCKPEPEGMEFALPASAHAARPRPTKKPDRRNRRPGQDAAGERETVIAAAGSDRLAAYRQVAAQ